MLTARQRRRFDDIMDAVVESLPPQLQELLEEVPVIVDDEPSAYDLEHLDVDPRTADLCGLHWGIPLTARSVEHSGTLPDEMKLFRGPIIRQARAHGRGPGELERQIRITLLHEIGHHFGLDEDDLEALGYA